MPVSEPAASNRLLASLSAPHRRHLLAASERVELAAGAILHTPATRIGHVYFPIGCLITLVVAVDRTARLAVGHVGREGACGLPVILGVDRAPVYAIVQGAGGALRLGVAQLHSALAAHRALRPPLERYLSMMLTELARRVACTRFHSLQARLAFALAQTADGTGSDHFRLTHQALADQLAVRRVGVTTAAGALKQGGLIGYRRGEITILDRAGLERTACVCYRAGRALHDRTYGPAATSS